jgi:Domain of unknown function (DUF4276)
VKIAILVEGRTETGFKRHLTAFLTHRLLGKMPRLDMVPYDGRIPTERKLRRLVELLLSQGKPPADAVIALTDVYTGNAYFVDAADAKAKMRSWVGQNDRFHPHVAQYDFEAWLLPYWDDIQRIAGHNRRAPSGPPETINHERPPSHYIREIFRIGTCRDHYSKARDANCILQGKDLAVAAAQCPELRAFLNTILTLSGGRPC